MITNYKKLLSLEREIDSGNAFDTFGYEIRYRDAGGLGKKNRSSDYEVEYARLCAKVDV